MLKSSEKDQVLNHGLDVEIVEQQIDHFKNGFPPTELSAPALVGEGITALSPSEVDSFIAKYDESTEASSIVKFVPASGAATRMFKTLYAFIQDFDGSEEAYNKLISDTSRGSVFSFFKAIEKFAFFTDLKTKFNSNGTGVEAAILKRQYTDVIKCLLEEDGLSYGVLPKGLLKFHQYGQSNRTPLEEHIVEGAQYAKCGNGEVNIHFTVSAEHQPKFEAHVSEIKGAYENAYGVKISISYSQQKPSTDTIAVDLENQPFTSEDGKILFRPAGHGALLENLNEIDADIIFLKNIDNVVPDRFKPETIKFKKVIAGLLLERQAQIFDYARRLQNAPNDELIQEVNDYLPSLGYQSSNTLDAAGLIKVLDRPIRVCGMVKSEGDPGGGPFWVSDGDGNTSLQVVETAQIDLSNADQKSVFNKATHFNPVDVVCGVRNYEGKKFDLLKYRDPATGFVTEKSQGGKDLKAQELPGLWNGSMADWNTVFVEVPVITFNPVKSVNDLLLPEHQ
ncbi:MAG: DUF4301 family protein [Cyclobacteriaceae bacterium]